MSKQDDQTGEVLEEVARIHPLVDRLRDLLSSAAFLDMKASRQGYWAGQREAGEQTYSSGAA